MTDSHQCTYFLDTKGFTSSCFRKKHKSCAGNFGRCTCPCHKEEVHS